MGEHQGVHVGESRAVEGARRLFPSILRVGAAAVKEGGEAAGFEEQALSLPHVQHLQRGVFAPKGQAAADCRDKKAHGQCGA